jgi:hypothetical protein
MKKFNQERPQQTTLTIMKELMNNRRLKSTTFENQTITRAHHFLENEEDDEDDVENVPFSNLQCEIQMYQLQDRPLQIIDISYYNKLICRPFYCASHSATFLGIFIK